MLASHIWLSGSARFFLYFPAEAIAGPVEPDGDGAFRAPDDLTDAPVRELLPDGEPQQLLIRVAQPSQRIKDGPALVLGLQLRLQFHGESRLAAQSQGQIHPPLVAPALVGQDPASDAVEPWQGAVAGWQFVQATPGDREGLGHGILGVAGVRDAATGVGEDGPIVGLVDGLEPPSVVRWCVLGVFVVHHSRSASSTWR